MKKNVYLFLILFLSLNLYPQGIRWDKLNNNGERHIGTKSIDLTVGKGNYSFSLTSFSKNNLNTYYLLIGSYSFLVDENVVMLRLGNEEIVKLTASNINQGKVNSLSFGNIPSQQINYYTALYRLSDNDLSKIIENGVLQLRIQLTNTYSFNEREWKNDKIGKHMKKNYNKIIERLSTTEIRTKSIGEDF